MSNSLRPIINKILKKNIKPNGQDWTIFYYEQDESIFSKIELSDFFSSYTKYTESKHFRLQLHIETIPYLVGFDTQTKEIYILSPRANIELYLIKVIQSDALEPSSLDDFNKLKNHTEKVLGMDLYQFPAPVELQTEIFSLSKLDDNKFLVLDDELDTIREELSKKIESYNPSLFEKISDYGLTLTANYDLLRIHLLKFVAILSSLTFDKTGFEIKRMLMETFRRLILDSQRSYERKLKGTQKSLPKVLLYPVKSLYHISRFMPAKVLSTIVQSIIKILAKRFIAGTDIHNAESSLRYLLGTNRDATLDQLGELVVSKPEAEVYFSEVINLIKGFSNYVSPGSKNKAGILKAHISIKVSALSHNFNPLSFEETYKRVAPKLKQILLVAKEHQVYINIDAEHYDYRDLVFNIYKKVLLETEELFDYQQTGIVLQMYLKDAYEHFLDILDLAKARKLTMPIRLVKGAYWDAETVKADAHSYDAPEFLNKEETDIHYRQVMIEIFENYPHVQLCLGGHNLRDHCFGEIVRERYYPQTPIIEHQCLHMTYEALSVGMSRMNWVVRNYVPIGSLLVGMAYLVRRIMENSSQVGVLTQMRSHKRNFSILPPYTLLAEKKEKKNLSYDASVERLGDYFFNIPPVREYKKDEYNTLLNEITRFPNNLGRHYNKTEALSGELTSIYSNSDRSLLVGEINFASLDDCEKALTSTTDFYNNGDWAKADHAIRASYLLKAAQILLLRRVELAVLITYEAGKTLSEALADIDEAIDFIHFYTRSAGLKFSKNESLVSRGPILVISPWNFPLAIPCGMVTASLIAGNTAILKSAEQTPLIAQALVDIFHEAGVPKQAIIHMPGIGETIGDKLVRDKRIAGIVFTGSKAVGVSIAEICSNRYFENKVFKYSAPVKVITEMGGKNAIIVTANAELDETVDGILYSAFAHAGQKCSACSRVIIDNKIKDKFLDRFIQAAKDINIGKGYERDTFINPLSDTESYDRIKSLSSEIEKEAQDFSGKVHLNRIHEDLPGLCVGPMLVELPYNRSLKKESFAQRELFAPIIHIIGYDKLQNAVKLFNSTNYALTGGIYSQSQDDIDYLSKSMECGNLYVNRPNTGARVGIEPFGGFKLSGTGPKAGSDRYIDAFLVDRSLEPEVESLPDENGSDYQFELAKKSGVGPRGRIRRISKGLKIFLHQFEGIFGGIYSYEKENIKEFFYWINQDAQKLLFTEQDNVVIPGQLSFDNFRFRKKQVILVALNKRPSTKILLSFLSALLAGTGVTVVARNESIYSLWSNIADCFYNAGISRNNLNVCFCSEAKLLESLSNPKISAYIFDGDLESLNRYGHYLYSQKDELFHMKKIISQYDGPSTIDFEQFLYQFIEIRSFAINTMRHGAPLDLRI